MKDAPKLKTYVHRFIELPSINKLALIFTPAPGEEYGLVNFYLSKDNALISVEIDGEHSYPEKVLKYYFSDSHWVSTKWETESEAMKAPLGKDYPIRLLKSEQNDEIRREARKLTKWLVRHRTAYPDLAEKLFRVLSSDIPDKSIIKELELEVKSLIAVN